MTTQPQWLEFTGVCKYEYKNVNEKAEFIACTNHSLNLAGVHAAGETVNSIDIALGPWKECIHFFPRLTDGTC